MIREFNFTFLTAPVLDEKGRMDEPPSLWTFRSSYYEIVSVDHDRIVFVTVPGDDGKEEPLEFIVNFKEHLIYRRPAGAGYPGEVMERIM
jgi:hypothetical protein